MKAVPSGFQKAGETILLLEPIGPPKPTNVFSNEEALRSIGASARTEAQRFGSSAYAKHILGELWGTLPYLDLEEQASLNKCLFVLASEELLSSAQDICDGGLAVALAKAAFTNSIGADVNVGMPPGVLGSGLGLFADDAGQVLVTCARTDVERIKHIAEFHYVWVKAIGETVSDHLRLSASSVEVIHASIHQLKVPWLNALEHTLAAVPVLNEVLA